MALELVGVVLIFGISVDLESKILILIMTGKKSGKEGITGKVNLTHLQRYVALQFLNLGVEFDS